MATKSAAPAHESAFYARAAAWVDGGPLLPGVGELIAFYCDFELDKKSAEQADLAEQNRALRRLLRAKRTLGHGWVVRT